MAASVPPELGTNNLIQNTLTGHLLYPPRPIPLNVSSHIETIRKTKNIK